MISLELNDSTDWNAWTGEKKKQKLKIDSDDTHAHTAYENDRRRRRPFPPLLPPDFTARRIPTFPHCEHLSFCVLLCIQWCLTVLCSLYCRTPSSLKLDLHLAASGRLFRHSECTMMRHAEHFRRAPCFCAKREENDDNQNRRDECAVINTITRARRLGRGKTVVTPCDVTSGGGISAFHVVLNFYDAKGSGSREDASVHLANTRVSERFATKR